MVFPTIHISCPCADSISITPKPAKKKSRSHKAAEEEESEEEERFDPRSARSNFSLFPLESLLYCEDCNQIRCPRCVHDEIVCYFCPSCLFEVPSSAIKSDGNRCTRNCFSCPICFASLVVASTRDDQGGPYVLLCPHCHWSSSEIGIEFEKPTSITTQLAQKLKTVSTPSVTPAPSVPSDSYFPTISITPTISLPPNDAPRAPPTTAEMYQRLKVHYASQRASTGTDEFGSNALSRLIGLYSSTSLTVGGPKPRSFSGGSGISKPLIGRDRKSEWSEMDHTLEIQNEDATIAQLRKQGFAGTTSTAQRLNQGVPGPLFTQDVRPLAVLLRTKRSKRCRACRHILVKPESKVTTTRFRIKLVAMNYIPSLSISRLDPGSVNYNSLTPLTTHQFLLTVTNPLFDAINVTLATPQRTPGRFGTTVTILCPDFEVGANSDIWDEALGTGDAATGGKNTRKGKKTGNTGTVWDAGRNWTTVVIEIVPPLLPSEYTTDEAGGKDSPTEDDYLVQVPVSVRVEYETDVEREDGLGKEVKERREHTYWSVLGLGRIGKFGAPTTPLAVGTGGPVDLLGALGPSGVGLGRSSTYNVAKVGSSPPIVAGMVGMGVAGGLGKRNLK
ncbi:uncharacterized protein H6S33_003052 [Morchella sextelata]|uniref:uncharacterized protein n=1 Tax=Morchella sextelata TaxID=1174677 RepID=UPI001D0407C6|nr:uncharacterized protein H6S33_003052 [Morchella sextelata]KAH0607064.1 hypothetical protein H6S33_003052 [Morchella sextelata]